MSRVYLLNTISCVDVCIESSVLVVTRFIRSLDQFGYEHETHAAPSGHHSSKLSTLREKLTNYQHDETKIVLVTSR